MKKQTVVEFEIKSLDSTRPISQAVVEVRNLTEDLQVVVSRRFPSSVVRIRRGEGTPIVSGLEHILVYVDWDVVKKGVETAVAGFVTQQFLILVKNRIKNLIAKKVGPGKTSDHLDSSKRDSARKKRRKPSRRRG